MTHDQVERALEEGERTGERLGEILLRRRLVDERQLAALLARQWLLPFVDDHEGRIDDTLLAGHSAEDARRTGAVPLRCEDGLVRMVVDEPTEERFAAIRARTPHDVSFGVVTRTRLQRLLVALDQPRQATNGAGEAPAEATDETPERRLDYLLTLFDDETAHLKALREKVERFANNVAEWEHAVRRLESEVETERNARAHDRLALDRLRREAVERTGLLDLARSKAEELAAALRAGSVH